MYSESAFPLEVEILSGQHTGKKIIYKHAQDLPKGTNFRVIQSIKKEGASVKSQTGSNNE